MKDRRSSAARKSNDGRVSGYDDAQASVSPARLEAAMVANPDLRPNYVTTRNRLTLHLRLDLQPSTQGRTIRSWAWFNGTEKVRNVEWIEAESVIFRYFCGHDPRGIGFVTLEQALFFFEAETGGGIRRVVHAGESVDKVLYDLPKSTVQVKEENFVPCPHAPALPFIDGKTTCRVCGKVLDEQELFNGQAGRCG